MDIAHDLNTIAPKDVHNYISTWVEAVNQLDNTTTKEWLSSLDTQTLNEARLAMLRIFTDFYPELKNKQPVDRRSPVLKGMDVINMATSIYRNDPKYSKNVFKTNSNADAPQNLATSSPPSAPPSPTQGECEGSDDDNGTLILMTLAFL